VNYLKDIRIKEAKRLLEETDMLVIEISQKVGYENEKHFMKIFKGVCGVSPTEYRKNMQFTK
jgi:two-component system response regulator YesN